MKTLFSILFVILPIAVVAQMGKVVGKVRDSKGEPLIGASVIYKKDITIGATTDENGNYMLEVPAGKSMLVCRYSGMITDTMTVSVIADQTVNFDIVLNSVVVELKDVEVKV
ncbi:MAG: carboxypeptidase-like regulatory domain-containing protein, partial [Flavobacteriia bacterium]